MVKCLKPIGIHFGKEVIVYRFINTIGEDRINAAFGAQCGLFRIYVFLNVSGIHGAFTVEAVALVRSFDQTLVMGAIGM